MNIVTISTLYPNNKDFKHGVFVENRLRHLQADFPEVALTVIAPVPWFPFKSKSFGEYSRFAGVARVEERHGIKIYHPRYLVVPKIGMYLTPVFLKWSISLALKKLLKQGEVFDLIDGHYFYPDGIAIAAVAEAQKIPFTCTARGTDINLIPQYSLAKSMIQHVFTKAAHMMSVCQALKTEMLALGARDEQVTVLRNGVDLEAFAFADEEKQQRLKLKYTELPVLIVSVGWLIERKGHHLVIEAMRDHPEAMLCIAGDGPDRAKLESLAKSLGVEDRVRFMGSLKQADLAELYQAADLSVLASSREGWANVLLESMSCGTPVVATRVWGTPEVVSELSAGVLVERSVEGIVAGIHQLKTDRLPRNKTRQHAEKFSWQATSEGQMAIFRRILNQ